MSVALVDDEEDALAAIARVLREAGYQSSSYLSGEDLLAALGQGSQFDVIVADWNMPGMTGIELIQRLGKQGNVKPPVIILTSRSKASDIAFALEAGADDVIVKPADASHFLARIDALIRYGARSATASEVVSQFGDFQFDGERGVVSYAGKIIELAPDEYALALLLFRNLNLPVSRLSLLEALRSNREDATERMLDKQVFGIRWKLGLSPENGFLISTVSGYGYRLQNI